MLKIGLIGFGTVNKGVYEGIIRTKERLKEIVQDEIIFEKILVKDKTKHNLDLLITDDIEDFFNHHFDVVFEAIGGVQPALDYIKQCLSWSIPVITANKELIAKHGETIEQMAEQNNTFIGYEAAVAGGVPIVNVLKGQLHWTEIKRVTGILNGTTNYILTHLEDGERELSEVLAEAQRLGYAEADPTNDIEGYDALYKVQILSRLCFGFWPTFKQFERRGMTHLNQSHFSIAKKLNCKLKYIADASFDGVKMNGYVSPCFVVNDHVLAAITDVNNGVQIESDWLGEYLASGPGAGKKPTATSMIEDYLFHLFSKKKKLIKGNKEVSTIDENYAVLIGNKDDIELLLSHFNQNQIKLLHKVETLNNVVGFAVELNGLCPLSSFKDLPVEAFPMLRNKGVTGEKNQAVLFETSNTLC